jgi:hypothetical protein
MTTPLMTLLINLTAGQICRGQFYFTICLYLFSFNLLACSLGRDKALKDGASEGGVDELTLEYPPVAEYVPFPPLTFPYLMASQNQQI